MTLEGVQPARRDFDNWYGVARPRVLATLILICGDVDAASDATDEAFLRALSRWPSVSEMESPIGWTIRVAINVVRRTQRRAAIEHRLLRRMPRQSSIAGPAGEAWLAVRDLPPRQRETLVMRYVGDMLEADIAAALGLSRSAVSSALSDGRRRLAELLTDLSTPEEVPHG